MTSTSTDRRYGLTGNNGIKTPVRVATTVNTVLSGLQTIDSVVLADNDRVLVKSQTDASENGIYSASTSAWTRTLDFDGKLDVVKGTSVYVNEGASNIGYWQLSTDDPITIGTSSLTFRNVDTMLSGLEIRSTATTFAVGRNANNLGIGLQVGGGNVSYGTDGILLAPDGNNSWLRFQPSVNESTIELLIYPSASQGVAEAQTGTDQIIRTSGTSFTSDWIGKKFYFGPAVYQVETVTDGDNMTVSNVLSGTIPFASTYSETFHVAQVHGTGTCNVSGTTVTRVSGDPFISFIGAPFVFKINGVTRTVSSFTDISTYELSAGPGDVTDATYTFETCINDQLSTLRLQKMLGSDEENLSIYANYYGYNFRSFYAGAGKERPIQFGTATKNHLTLQTNGDVSIGGDYTYEAIRVLYAANGVNRLETTPAPTGFGPSWRARGADANVDLLLDTQGTGTVTFTNHAFGNTSFQIFGTAGTSWLGVSGDAANQPTLSANGAATDIDIKLAPKGAGLVWLGPVTNTGDVAITGYMTLKDSSGNTVKVAKVA